jgi:RNA polymerase sigma-70 factor (ECF subfamily)
MAENASEPFTRPSLLLRIRDPGDTESWNTFVEVYGPLIHRYGRSRGLQWADAENVTQEVFTKVAQAIRTFDYRPEQGRFRDWLGTVTCNEIKRFLKKEIRAVRGRGGPSGEESG